MKLPPRKRRGGFPPFPSSSNTAKAAPGPSSPPPSDDQDVPFHRPMPLTMTPPAWLKEPVANRAGRPGPGPSSSKVTKSSTNPFVPPPTSDQDAPFQRAILLALMPRSEEHTS